jgi:hypothetical protein
MTLLELKTKVLSLIEELNEESEYLTDDPDIAAKLLSVINMVMFEMARLKKIPKYVETEVEKGDILTFEDISNLVGSEVYQINMIGGVNHQFKGDGTIVKILESGTAEVDVFVYPERLTEKTKDNFTLELSQDALEIMPYGIAGDLLKSDVSADYGKIYTEEFERRIARLDSRNNMASIYVDGGAFI